MAKVPPATWENPAAFTPDEAGEDEAQRPPEPEPEPEADDGSFKRIAKEDDEAVEEPEEPRH
jgi:hypothetical protein